MTLCAVTLQSNLKSKMYYGSLLILFNILLFDILISDMVSISILLSLLLNISRYK